MKALVALLLWAVLVVPSALWWGLLARDPWAWFLTPVTGWEAPGVVALGGLLLVVRTLFHPYRHNADQDSLEVLGGALASTLLTPPLLYAAAWVLAGIAGAR